MDLKIETFPFVAPKTTRFSRIGVPSDQIKEVVVALHGYGQLAPVFAESLLPLATEERLIVCPEALSRFYTSHRHRVVGATWMTYEEREFEIMDYVLYLDDLIQGILEDVPADVVITVLGFSQGCPTASRWIGNDGVAPDRIILWGADPAHDHSDDEWNVLADVPEIVLVAGSNDKIMTEDRLIKAEEALRDHQCSFRTLLYEGGHDIDKEVLTSLFE